MSSLPHIRRSRRLSRKSPVELVDYDWPSTDTLQLLYPPSHVELDSIHLSPKPPSTCTTSDSNSPPPVVTHLPFTPGSSHTRNRKQGHIPRPPNAFMVFRSWLWNKDNLKSIEKDNRNVSRIAGRYWNELSEAERAPFRCMAEEAKARHAQLYPEYKYAPGSQRKANKAAPRRCQRTATTTTTTTTTTTNDSETEKCKKVADLLLGGVTSHDLAKYLGDGHKRVKLEEESVPDPTAPASLGTSARKTLKRPATPCHASSLPKPRRKKQKTLPPPVVSPPSGYPLSLPTLSAAEEWLENMPPLAPMTARTPELVYPPDDVQEFVPTDQIPHLSLDNCDHLTLPKHEEDDLSPLFLSHLEPGAHSVLSGVKPEATSFVESCVLGAHTSDAVFLPSPVPFARFEVDAYPSLVPLGSPVFSNPFDSSTPSAEHAALLGTLDQLFGQPISPLTSICPYEN